MYHVSAQGVDERMINVHYYYFKCCPVPPSCHSVPPPPPPHPHPRFLALRVVWDAESDQEMSFMSAGALSPVCSKPNNYSRV